jgi:hypothetical protein
VLPERLPTAPSEKKKNIVWTVYHLVMYM